MSVTGRFPKVMLKQLVVVVFFLIFSHVQAELKRIKKNLHTCYWQWTGCEDLALCGTMRIKTALDPMTHWHQLSIHNGPAVAVDVPLFTSLRKRKQSKKHNSERHHIDSTINTDLDKRMRNFTSLFLLLWIFTTWTGVRTSPASDGIFVYYLENL